MTEHEQKCAQQERVGKPFNDDTLTAARSVTLLARLLQVVFGLAALGHWFMAETGTAALPVLAFVGRALLALGIVAVIEYVVVRRGGADD